MEASEYHELYKRLDSSNIQSLSKYYRIQEAVLTIILHQKIVRDVRRHSQEIKKNSHMIKNLWENGEEILSISKKLNFPPTLIASILLKEFGFSDKGRKRALKDPSNINDLRLRSEVVAALKEDEIYSPSAHRIQFARGKLGESIISNWLIERRIAFKPEAASRGTGIKTPDFVIEDTMTIDDRSVNWIESKASFGDEELHKYYIKKQYSSCLNMFGEGMIIYWYGFIKIIEEIEPRLFIVDHNFFPESNTDGLFKGKL